MSEKEYILATDLQRIRDMKEIMKSLIPNIIPEKPISTTEYVSVLNTLSRWEEDHKKLITIK